MHMVPELLSRDSSVLVVIDVQENLLPHIHEHDRLLRRLDLLLAAVRTMGIPVVLTEQYPRGLGPTVEKVRQAIPGCDPLSKMEFSCASGPGFADRLAVLKRTQIVLVGIEAHVCVAQSALELAGQGQHVYVVADATGSRRPFDAETAMRRLQSSGVVVTTAEAVVFEWLRRAGGEEFKALQQKIKELA